MAAIIRQIKREGIKAVFAENIKDTRMVDRIAKETGVRVSGKLYSDALSSAPANTLDLAKLEKGQTLTLKDIALPKGVEAVLHGHSAEDMVLVSVVMPAAEAEAEAAPAADAPAARGPDRSFLRP